MSAAKTSLIVITVGAAILTGLYFLGKNAAEEKAKQAEKNAAKEAAGGEPVTEPKASDDTSSTKENEVTQTATVSEATQPTAPQAASNTDRNVSINVSEVAPGSDEIFEGIESRYRRLVNAIHSGALVGETWSVNGPAHQRDMPESQAVAIRGMTIDPHRAMSHPRDYFNPTCGEGQIRLGYQFTARRAPVIFIRFEEVTFTLCDVESRFWVSAPSQDEFQVNTNWYLEQVMDELFKQLGIN